LIDVNLEDDSLRTFILFSQTADVVSKYTNALLNKKSGLSSIKFIVLNVLSANGGTLTPSEIANWTLTERHNITTMIERMARDGLVRTKRNSKDKRFVNISITSKGRKTLSNTLPAAEEVVNQIMSSMSGGDVNSLEKSLGILRENAHLGLEQIANPSQTKRAK